MEQDLSYIRPRAMGKGELAMLYAPDLKMGSALNRLAHWMRRSPQLMRDLADADYRPQQRLLTVRQVEIIFRHLGQP